MSDRKVQLEISRDGGHTWPIKREMTLGELGAYKHRILFRRLGVSRRVTAKFIVTSPVKMNLFGAIADIEVADS